MDNLAVVTIPLTPDQSAEITQIIESEEEAPLRIFANVSRNVDDPPLFDLRVILQF